MEIRGSYQELSLQYPKAVKFIRCFGHSQEGALYAKGEKNKNAEGVPDGYFPEVRFTIVPVFSDSSYDDKAYIGCGNAIAYSEGKEFVIFDTGKRCRRAEVTCSECGYITTLKPKML